MWPSRKETCLADIRYSKNGSGAIETCITCPKCPNARLIQRLSANTTKVAKDAAKVHASVVIEDNCVVFKKLKAAGKIEAADKSFHRKLP
jgi:hypothetical protein